MNPPKAFIDACVLFSGVMREALLRLTHAKVYEIFLTELILEETRRNLVEKGQVTEEKGQSIVDRMRAELPFAFVNGYLDLIPAMPINEKDRHVLAAAVAGGCSIIVTQNLKDFPQSLLKPFCVEALSADDFLVQLFNRDKNAVIAVIKEQASRLKAPPLSVQELLEKKLKMHVPKFVQLVLDELSKNP